MKILYVSSNIDHHQAPLAKEIIARIGLNNFRYALLKPKEKQRIKFGFPDYSENEWLIHVYRNDSDSIEFKRWFLEADIVISNNRSLIKLYYKRLKLKKIVFYFSERWWKPPIGKFRLFHPYFLYLSAWFYYLSLNKPFYYLAQGSYAQSDIEYLGLFKHKIFNWGYFACTKSNARISANSQKINILWCGRMLKWKKLDVLILAFSRVLRTNKNIFLRMIGDGLEFEKLKRLAKQLLDPDSYDFQPSQSFTSIRKEMSNSDIYVLASNGTEGWGVVLNEAMAEGSAVIASDKAGASKIMIKHNYNGLLFNSDDPEDLAEKLLFLISNPDALLKLRSEGQVTINKLWSPCVAAERFITICEDMLGNKHVTKYPSGPMSQQ